MEHENNKAKSKYKTTSTTKSTKRVKRKYNKRKKRKKLDYEKKTEKSF